MSAPLTVNQLLMARLVANEFFSRTPTWGNTSAQNRDYPKILGYPESISDDDYRKLIEREAVAERVACLVADECWKDDPEVWEIEEQEDTDFETAVKEAINRLNIWHTLAIADRLACRARYSAVLIGFDDVRDNDLSQPVQKATWPNRRVLFLNPFEECQVEVVELDTDPGSERWGQPSLYRMEFADVQADVTGKVGTVGTKQDVHWSRVVHLAPDRTTSKWSQKPGLEGHYNRLTDYLRKVLGGSGEMWWLGAIPRFNFNIDPAALMAGNAEFDAEATRSELDKWANGLQPYLAMIGVDPTKMAPDVADPTAHINAQLQAIAVGKAVPLRILLGSEQGELASSQDRRNWNDRVGGFRRRTRAPYVIRPLVDRFIEFGALPIPGKGPAAYFAGWPDPNAMSDGEKADIAVKLATSLKAWLDAGGDAYLPFKEFLTTVWKLPLAEAEAIVAAGNEQAKVGVDDGAQDDTGATQ